MTKIDLVLEDFLVDKPCFRFVVVEELQATCVPENRQIDLILRIQWYPVNYSPCDPGEPVAVLSDPGGDRGGKLRPLVSPDLSSRLLGAALYGRLFH